MKIPAHYINTVKVYSIKRIYLSLIFMLLSSTIQIKAEVFDIFKEPCLFVYLTNGGVDAYPLNTIEGKYYTDGDSTYIKLLSGNVVRYHTDEYLYIDTEIPILPYMTSYKFNNKYNPNLNKDVGARITDGNINVRLNAIGKSLTASFQLSDEDAIAYIGNDLQTSKESRNRFDRTIRYTITYPNYNVVSGTEKKPFGRIYNVETEWLTDNSKVARMDINIENGHSVVSKNYYLNADVSITGYGVYDDFRQAVQIKGRGNNSWNYKKKSYRLKFAQKEKPFGLTKGKSWVLLANPQDGSLMVNAVAMKIGQLCEAKYTNHIIPVELYINGEYQGSYIFTEHVGLSNNSVDVDEEIGYMLELDSYYDEDFKFRSVYSDLPVNIKEPDLLENEKSTVSSSLLESMLNDNCLNTIPSQKFPNSSPIGTIISNYNAKNEKFNVIKEQFNRLDSVVCCNGDLSKVLDLDAAARYFLVIDLTLNREILHPKSTFLWKADISSKDSKFIFGPIWDFDYAFGYSDKTYFINASRNTFPLNDNFPGGRFFKALRKNREFQRHYYKVWCEFVEKDCIKEVMEYMQDYYEFVKDSYSNNAEKWGDNTDYGNHIPVMQEWIKGRHDYIVKNLTEYDITDLINNPQEKIGDDRENYTFRQDTDIIYTVYGERVTNTENLRQGIYIINGKKVFIKKY